LLMCPIVGVHGLRGIARVLRRRYMDVPVTER
jgi:hypothetical protein